LDLKVFHYYLVLKRYYFPTFNMFGRVSEGGLEWKCGSHNTVAVVTI